MKIAQSQRGDTILEVLISMTILAFVLAATFLSTSHSLESGTDSTNRLQALSYVQQQAEIIKDDVNAGHLSNYQTLSLADAAKFCVVPFGPIPGTFIPHDTNCTGFYSYGQYTVSDAYKNGLFTVTATWAGSNASGNVQNHLSLYYRVTDSSAFLSGGGSVTVTLRPLSPCDSSVTSGDNCKLEWTISGSPASCQASSNPFNASWYTGTTIDATNGVHDSGNIQINSSTIFYLSCTKNGINTDSNPPATINVSFNPPTNNGVTAITSTTATLHGIVNPQGVPTTCYFKYSTSLGGVSGATHRACAETIDSGTNDISVSYQATGLTTGTRYNFLVCTSNSSGDLCANSINNFKTL